MSDPHLIPTPDGAEIECIGGVVSMSDGLANAVILSLDGGGNEDDPGRADLSRQYWANTLYTAPERRLRSEYIYLTNTLPLTSGSRQLFEEAAKRDLSWLLRPSSEGAPALASSVTVSVTYPSRRSVRLEATIMANGRDYPFKLDRNL